MKTALGLLTLLFCTSATLASPISKGTTMFIEPKTLRYYASFVGSAMTITDSDRIIHFPTGGSTNEELIRVPLEVTDPHVVIRITVAIQEHPRGVQSDPHVGLSDGENENTFRIDDSNGYCHHSSGSRRNPSLPSGSVQHYEYIMLFEPFQKYGACSHFGGHITPGYFTARIFPSKGLDFIVKRENTGEVYDFYYFLIEIL